MTPVGIVTDVRVPIGVDAALRECEARYRSLFAANPHPMWYFDTETLAFLDVNDAAVAHYGFQRAEFLAMTIADIRPAEDMARLREAVGRVGESAIDEAGVWRHRKKNGSIIFVEITSHAVDYNGRRAEVVLVHDITDRTKAEAALRESEERLRLFVREAPVAIAMFDRDMCYLAASARWLTDYGLGNRDLSGLSHYEVLPEIPERWKETHRRALAGEVVRAEEDRFQRADGSIQWLQWEIRPWRTEDRNVGGIVIFAEDVTSRRKTEQELRESRERYRAMFEVAPVGVAQADPATGRWLTVNPRMCLITGYSADELLTMKVPEITHPEDRDLDWLLFQNVVKGAAPEYRLEKRYLRKDGSIAWVNVNMVVLRDAAGRPTRTLAMIEDITERKRAARRLLLQAEMGRVLAEAASLAEAVPRILRALGENEGMAFGAWWEPDPDSGMLQCAHTWSADPGRCAGLAAATRSLEVEPGEGIPGTVWATRTAFHVTDLAKGKGSPRAPVAALAGFNSAVGFPLLRQGEPVGVVEFFAPEIRNLDPALAASVEMLGGQIAQYLERRRAEEESSRYVAGSPAVIYALRVAGDSLRVTWFSDNILVLTGYSHAEIEKDPQAWWTSAIHPEDRERVYEANRVVLEKDAASLEFRFRRKDGSWLWVRDEKRLLRDEAGRPTEVVGSWMDVTARVRLEEQLRQSQKMEAIGQLAGGVAHDFNNLLTVISGNSDLLLSGMPADDPRRVALADIRAAGERAAALTRQLLAFSRKQILEPRLVDVHEVVTGIEKMLRRLIGEDVDLLTDLTANPSWVKVDPGQLEQVVMNLAVNARDAMPRGGRITIRTWNVDMADTVDSEETAGRRLRPKVAISVSDTGSGISPDARGRLFEPFFTTKGVGKGTGLGLATVYGIVKQSEGDITVESEPGKGATFTIVLPSQAAPPRPGETGATLRAVPRGSETVLVVEDEDSVRRIVRIALESTGYRVIEARSGPEALEAARTHAGGIHLVVTDVVMPGMSGRELAERLAKDHRSIRILYVSGYTDDAVMRHGIVEAGVAFLQKPFSPLALAKKVREVLDAGV